MFRNENTVPNTSFASSSPALTVWPSPVEAAPGAGGSAERDDFPTMEVGLGSQRRL